MQCLALLLALALTTQRTDPTIRVGSKVFTESVILGEIGKCLIREAGVPVAHRRELGGTQVLFHALLAGEIDVYPEYTGTISGEILADKNIRDEAALRSALAVRGVGMSRPLGFDDKYAIGMLEEFAARTGMAHLSDLARHPGLKLGFSNEFMNRADGWPGLRDFYHLPQLDVRGLDHDLAYRALANQEIGATDLYSTDAEIKEYNLRVLDDDRHFFPSYQCVWLYRVDLKDRSPAALAAIERSEGTITTAEMTAMNARAKLNRVPEDRVAADFVAEEFGFEPVMTSDTLLQRLLTHLREHLSLVAISLAAAIAVSIPLGILAVPAPAGTDHPVGDRADPDDSLAGAFGLHDPLAGDRGSTRGRRTFSLQPLADRPQHGHRPARYPAVAPRIGPGPGAARVPGSGGSSCRWPRGQFSAESRRLRSSTSARQRSEH